MAAKSETGMEVVVGLLAILFAFVFVLIAFLLHNVVWVVPGMIFGIGYLIWVLEKNGLGLLGKPGVKS